MSHQTPDPGSDTNLNQLPVLRHHEEQRRYPRIDLRLPVNVTTEDHHVVNARLRNVSAEGVQIRCTARAAARLHPRGNHIAPGPGPEVMLRFDLPVAGEQRPFAASARLHYIAVKSSDEIAFGLKFTRIRLEGKRLLAEWIMDCMRPRQ